MALTQFVLTVLEILFKLVNGIVKRLEVKARRDCKVVILASGKSNRWIASFKEDDPLYWKTLNKRLDDLHKIHEPPSKTPQHKSCGLVHTVPIIQHQFLSYQVYGMEHISAVVSRNTQAQKEIVDYMDDWNAKNKSKAKYEAIESDWEVAHSVFAGLKKIGEEDGDVIVGYSDIIWERKLLRALLAQKGGDIVVLVDPDWRDRNYPSYRIWHNELWAELVFGKKRTFRRKIRIKRIGEIVNRFEDVKDEPVEKFETIFLHRCIGEIIGLFKFSSAGRKVFLDEYARKLPDSAITVARWDELNVGFKLKEEKIPVREALLGSFLEYLSVEKKVDVRIVPVKGKWAEIDHWGDIGLAEGKFDVQLL